MTLKLQNSSNKSVHNLNRIPQILSSNYKLWFFYLKFS